MKTRNRFPYTFSTQIVFVPVIETEKRVENSSKQNNTENNSISINSKL